MSGSRVFVLLGLGMAVALAASPLRAASAAAEVGASSPTNVAGRPFTVAKADESKEDDSSKMSEADKRAKAVECSRQADAKKLHGEARKKFRSACKRG